MTDEEYIKRYRYSPRMRMVLPLEGGRYAVFNSIREVHVICDCADIIEAIDTVEVPPQYDWPHEEFTTVSADDLFNLTKEP
jgi:hypothetical protein